MLEDAISRFEEDNNSSVAVLYGTGGNFCAGFDLQEIASLNESHDSEVRFSIVSILDILCAYSSRFHLQLPSKPYVKKPMVAALSGYTVAGGLELALLCDLRVIEETAVVGLYGRRFGTRFSSITVRFLNLNF